MSGLFAHQWDAPISQIVAARRVIPGTSYRPLPVGRERREEIIGYDVDYQYQGRTYSTRMDHQPGSRIRVAVRVEPLE